jgi:leucyl/phenylalanyl-tRNA--protein transferase
MDCQMHTTHLQSLGARLIPRGEFVAMLARLTRDGEPPGPWPAAAIDGHYRKQP